MKLKHKFWIFIMCIIYMGLILNINSVSKAENITIDENTQNEGEKIDQEEITNNVNVEYIYNKDNTVTATIVSETQLLNTKPTWKLSDDKLRYSKTFKSNQKYITQVKDLLDNVTDVEVNITQIDDKGPEISLDYEYDSKTNMVTVIMNSNEVLANTKPTWNLSKDKTKYSKTFKSNQKYTTSVQDIWGNITNVKINVDQIDDKGPKIALDYELNKELNKVTVVMKSNEVLADTKPSWTLSEDKLEYSLIFNINKNYTTSVQDIWGNVTNVKINVYQIDDIPPTIKMEYKYNVKENTITAIMNSNEAMAENKPTWVLSEDKLKYSKTFSATTKQDYSTPVQDIYGNERWVKVKIQTSQYSYNNTKGPNITVKYIYDSNEKVTAYIISDKKLKDTKTTWNLDETQTIYTKTFSSNQMYNTLVKDIDGNEVTVSIIINFYKNTFKGIHV